MLYNYQRRFQFVHAGSSGSISMSKKSDMPYTCAFIQELMRFRTIAPLSVPHKTNADVNLDGHFIPRETVVKCSLDFCFILSNLIPSQTMVKCSVIFC